MAMRIKCEKAAVCFVVAVSFFAVLLPIAFAQHPPSSSPPTPPPPPPPPSDVVALTLEVPLDHFNAQVKKTFSLRYYVNPKFRHNASSPVIYYVGGDQAVTGAEIATSGGITSLPAAAQALGALLVAAEPRYYGESLPFGPDPTNEQLGWLSIEQTLADHASVLQTVQKAYAVEGPTYVIGTSLGGFLAAALRIKYGHLVWGAQASSAPMNVDGSNPDDWFRVVSEVYQNQSAKCGDVIRRGWQAVLNATTTDSGRAALTQSFHLCSPLQGDSTSVLYFLYWARLAFSWVAQFNFPYPTMFQAPTAPAPHLCNLATSAPTPLEGVAAASIFGWNWTYTATPCMNVTDMLFQPTTPKSLKYLACTQLLAPMGSNGVTDLFSLLPYNLSQTNVQCQQWFGTNVDPTYIQTYYGGVSLRSASRIAFTNGIYDPTRALSVQQSLSPLLPAFVSTAAHSQDLYPAVPGLEDPSVQQLRGKVVEAFREWTVDWWLSARAMANTVRQAAH